MTQDKMAGVRALMLNKTFIAEDVTKYINVNYPIHLMKSQQPRCGKLY